MQIIRGKIPGAKKVVCYGPEGIGKSTFASQFPDPVFIDTEGSTKDMDVARTETPGSWQMLTDQVRYFISHPGELKTLVVDTADWAEQMCSASVCSRYQKSGIEDFAYGKGYIFLQEEFGRLLNLLTDLVEKNGIHVVLTAHAKMRKFEQPDEMGAYDRWEMKLSKQVAPMVKEWSDMVLFANFKTWSVAVDDKGKKRKAQGGARVMYTSHHPCWDAKNRYSLPEEVPFGYDSIRHIVEGAGTGSPGPASAPQQAEQHAQQQPGNPATSIQPPHQPSPGAGQQTGTPVQQILDLNQDTTQSYPDKFRDIPPEAPGGDMSSFLPDMRIPKALRDLMVANGVCEWDIQSVVEARGYFPADMDIWDYPEDFTGGVLVGAWPQVLAMIREMKEKDAIPFN
ncbi:MAG: ATP-binding protein [Lachnospiraceae bacterium]|nr:ATP-binding protein [Lachnospiraceae bacterium]